MHEEGVAQYLSLVAAYCNYDILYNLDRDTKDEDFLYIYSRLLRLTAILPAWKDDPTKSPQKFFEKSKDILEKLITNEGN